MRVGASMTLYKMSAEESPGRDPLAGLATKSVPFDNEPGIYVRAGDHLQQLFPFTVCGLVVQDTRQL